MINNNSNNKKLLFQSRAISKANMTWRRAVESSQVMRLVFIRLILLLTDGLTKEWCIATYLFWQACTKIAKKSGWLFLALYLKQARVVLQKSVSGDTKPVLSVYVSLNRGGLPRIIPSFHRVKIKNGDYNTIQLYMSLFSVSRLIALAPKVTTQTFDSIVTPANLDSVRDVAGRMKPHLEVLLRRYVPDIDSIPLFQGLEFMPTWKSVPSLPWYKRLLKKSGSSTNESLAPLAEKSSIFHILPYELAAFQFLLVFTHSRGEQFSQGCLWYHATRFAFDKQFNKRLTELSLEWFESRIGPFLPSCDALSVPPNTGNLCASLAGDGKRRIFAIGNYINQRLLAPVHQWLASVLKLIPMDGTFNQTKPLDRLHGVSGTVHSVDLKAATDRWPLLLLHDLILVLFGATFASSVVNSTLATNVFNVSFTNKRKSVCFVAGQPLGYLSSWPLFALSHHVLIWYAAEQVYPGDIFTKYAVLGDDVVIADDKVKDTYSSLLTSLGVGISEAKSLTSRTGGCEFAKKFRLNRMTVDVSPVSVKKILESLNPIGWYQLITTLARPLRVSTKFRLAGFGFKAISRAPKLKGRKGRRHMIMLVHSYDLSFELRLSIVIGKWIDPSLVGEIVFLIMEYLRPKDMILPPIEAFAYPGMADFNEYSLYQGWMKHYLKYLKWYYSLSLSDKIVLDDLLKPPVYIRTWFRPANDENHFRYGIMFRIYDMALKAKSKVYYTIEQQEIKYVFIPDPNVIYL